MGQSDKGCLGLLQTLVKIVTCCLQIYQTSKPLTPLTTDVAPLR